MLTLIVYPGLPDEQRYELRAGMTIGRTRENDVAVLHKSLSREHARIAVDGDRVLLTDLDSKNGTYVNGARVKEAELRAGDSVRCGDVEMRVADASGDAPAPSRTLDPAKHSTNLSLDELVRSGGDGRSMLRVATAEGPDRTEHKLQLLLRVAELLSKPRSIDALLSDVLDLAVRILDVDRAVVLVRDDAGALAPRATHLRPGVRASERAFSRAIVDYVGRTRMAALFTDALADPRVDSAKSVLDESIRAAMCAPLARGSELYGAIYVDNLRTTHRFDEEDLDFLTAFALQAAGAIENARLYARLEKEALVRSAYERFFPPKTAARLTETPRLGVVDAEVTALFADIAGFTAMSGTMAPRAIVDMLNEYFAVVSDVVFRHDGTLEKYIGDALLAVWGAPFPHDDDADRALAAAVDMQRAVRELGARMAARGGPPVAIHVGLNTGPVAAGNIGSEKYLQYATIGDATNVASRVCGLAGAGEIVIAQATVDRLKQRPWPLVALPPAQVRGKSEPLSVHRVTWE